MRASTAGRILPQEFSPATSKALFTQAGPWCSRQTSLRRLLTAGRQECGSSFEVGGLDELLEGLIPSVNRLLRADQLDEVRALPGLDDPCAHAEVRFALSCAASAHIASGISASDIQ